MIIPAAAIARLHLVRVIQAHERRLRDVHTARDAARFHMIGNHHIVGPHIEMPFFVAQHAAHYRTAVDADSHVQIHLKFSNS